MYAENQQQKQSTEESVLLYFFIHIVGKKINGIKLGKSKWNIATQTSKVSMSVSADVTLLESV